MKTVVLSIGLNRGSSFKVFECMGVLASVNGGIRDALKGPSFALSMYTARTYC